MQANLEEQKRAVGSGTACPRLPRTRITFIIHRRRRGHETLINSPSPLPPIHSHGLTHSRSHALPTAAPVGRGRSQSEPSPVLFVRRRALIGSMVPPARPFSHLRQLKVAKAYSRLGKVQTMHAGLKVKLRSNLKLPMNATTSTNVAAEVTKQSHPASRNKHQIFLPPSFCQIRVPSRPLAVEQPFSQSGVAKCSLRKANVGSCRLKKILRSCSLSNLTIGNPEVETVSPQAFNFRKQATARLCKAMQASRKISFASLACKPSFPNRRKRGHESLLHMSTHFYSLAPVQEPRSSSPMAAEVMRQSGADRIDPAIRSSTNPLPHAIAKFPSGSTSVFSAISCLIPGSPPASGPFRSVVSFHPPVKSQFMRTSVRVFWPPRFQLLVGTTFTTMSAMNRASVAEKQSGLVS
ncbi:MAG: hypothetical protein JWM16_5003 [Verrucomicrobiales bacterium]|nr:hypothetical protein [Verrucomicrobiales bacterium]